MTRINISTACGNGGVENLSVQYLNYAKVCHITIDASEIHNLDDRDFYRLVALEIVGQLLKMDQYENLLNVPVPKSHHSFNLFLQALREVLPAKQGPILIVLRNPETLTEWRRERLVSLFDLDRAVCSQKFGLVLA